MFGYLENSEIFFYKSEEKCKENRRKYNFMHSLKGVYLKQKAPEIINDIKFYPLKIEFSLTKARKIYFKSKFDVMRWYDELKKESGFSDINEFYKFDKDLSEGNYGQVKKGAHRITGEKVAIKVISKLSLSD
jgi:hypothetical protein